MVASLSNLRVWLQRLLAIARVAASPVIVMKFIPAPNPDGEVELFLESPRAGQPLPIPPQSLWLGYGATASEYVDSGAVDVSNMRRVLDHAAADIDIEARPILDLGCGAGRMIRHLREVAMRQEVWGLDISAMHIRWLKTHFSPPFHFALNTTLPHLPFADEYFGFIYTGSVFTHIDDFAEAWFLELRRLLVPNGILYCTLHDEHTRARLIAERHHPLAHSLRASPIMDPRRTVGDVLIRGQSADCNVFYHSRYLKTVLAPIFDIVSIEPAAYGYQTAWVLRKPQIAEK